MYKMEEFSCGDLHALCELIKHLAQFLSKILGCRRDGAAGEQGSSLHMEAVMDHITTTSDKKVCFVQATDIWWRFTMGFLMMEVQALSANGVDLSSLMFPQKPCTRA